MGDKREKKGFTLPNTFSKQPMPKVKEIKKDENGSIDTSNNTLNLEEDNK